MRPLIAVAGLCAFAVALVIAVLVAAPRATGSAAAAPTPEPYFTADPAVTSRVDPAGAYGRVAQDDRVDRARRIVRGFSLPIDGVGLPTDPELLPNSAREYRGGLHEGIDFPADDGTPVNAVAAGTIVRVDREYSEWSAEQRDAALAAAVALGYTPSSTLDLIRGRQVWIDHGAGIVSRYAHLSAVAPLTVGTAVRQGEGIGSVGSSGLPEGGPHLHLEIRMGSSYLGDGLEGEVLQGAINAAFGAS
ncbi:MAG: M23 family metallopeptidase [Chloroflexota bacterium]|nr:M23 family metallopeptidase [Chloroflexota bacterium]